MVSKTELGKCHAFVVMFARPLSRFYFYVYNWGDKDNELFLANLKGDIANWNDIADPIIWGVVTRGLED